MLKELADALAVPFLRKVLLAALFVALAFPLYTLFYSHPRFTQLLLEFTADDADRVAHHLSSVFINSQLTLSRESLPNTFNDDVAQVKRDFRMEELKLFAPNGEVIYSTDPSDIGTLNQHDYFHQRVAKGQAYSLVVRKQARTAEGHTASADVVEAYVPIMREGRFIGAFEIYFDITKRRTQLDGLLSSSATNLLSMSGLLLVVVLVMLVIASRSQRTREAALAALSQSEARLQNMADSAQDAIVEIDDQGRISFWNKAAERIFGFSAAETLGHDLHTLIAPQRFYSAFVGGFQHFHATGEGRLIGKTTEVIGLRKDGSEIPIEISIAASTDKYGKRNAIGILRDIRERKAAEQNLKLGASVMTHAAQGITVTDAKANIQLVNPAFTRLTGYSAEEVVGCNPRQLKSGRHDDSFYRALWQELLATGSWQGEIWNRRKNGEVYPEWLSLSAIYDAQGQITNFIGIFSDISQLKEVEQGLERLAFYDPLTAIPNRILFRERLQQALKEADRAGQGRRVALLYLDLDHFKQVNDEHGHPVGDRLLQECAKRIARLVREVDTVARLGGDEFTVVLSNQSDPAIATRIADKIIAALAEPFDLCEGHCDIRIGTSIGIAFYPDHASEISSLVKLADAAMYAAKQAGRNCFEIYQPPGPNSP